LPRLVGMVSDSGRGDTPSSTAPCWSGWSLAAFGKLCVKCRRGPTADRRRGAGPPAFATAEEALSDHSGGCAQPGPTSVQLRPGETASPLHLNALLRQQEAFLCVSIVSGLVRCGPQDGDRSLRSLSQMRLELRKGHLDGIE
jgi:hypothetical protein